MHSTVMHSLVVLAEDRQNSPPPASIAHLGAAAKC